MKKYIIITGDEAETDSTIPIIVEISDEEIVLLTPLIKSISTSDDFNNWNFESDPACEEYSAKELYVDRGGFSLEAFTLLESYIEYTVFNIRSIDIFEVSKETNLFTKYRT